ncbi:MAG: hypothetical protein WC010_00350 [Candidatus Absconditabacterales bacterium]
MKNVTINFIGHNEVPRKEKKHIKAQVAECMLTIFKEKKSIENLKKMATTQHSFRQKDFSIYSEMQISREKISSIFPNKISNNANYLLGRLCINKRDIVYLINVDDLFYMDGQYYIWPSNEKKIMYVTIN